MKPIGVFQKTRWIAHDVLLLCLLLLLTPVYWTLFFFVRSLIAISCLTSRCALEANVQLKKIAGVTWHLLIAINRNSLRRHAQKRAANISGT